MARQTDLLIIGAGPFGLTLAAFAGDLGINHLIVGKSMEFWKRNMPDDMYLRSAADWHLDASGEYTMERFLAEQGLTRPDVEPLSRRFYLRYVAWFQAKKQIAPIEQYVERLDYDENRDHRFTATMDDGSTIMAQRVALALGFKYFPNVPDDIAGVLPAGRAAHTLDLVEFADLRGKRVLILGGRQSAFEWAALLNEAGAAEVHLSHRHDSPLFSEADWSWVTPIMEQMVADPTLFRNLSKAEQDSLSYRLWAEGRLKVEPWLEARVLAGNVKLWPRTQVSSSSELSDGSIEIRLDNGAVLNVDQIILATGYKVNMERVPLLRAGNILPLLATRNGFPALDETFQTSVPGLYVTSMPANADFGPFFAFTVSVRTSAKIIARALLATQDATS